METSNASDIPPRFLKTVLMLLLFFGVVIFGGYLLMLVAEWLSA